jgi:hypothetical protein
MSAYKESTVSPRFRTGLIALRLASGALLLATLSSATLRAQTIANSMSAPPMGTAPGDDLPFQSVTDTSSYLGQTPLRVWHTTRSPGQEQSETALGTHWAAPTDGGLIFVDGQFRVGNQDQEFSGNFGVGARWRNDDFFTGSPRIFGMSVWYDGEDTQLDNWFNQIGVSFERLGPLVDLRLNVNIPLEDLKAGDDVTFLGDTVFTGNGLAQSTVVAADSSLRVVDFEAAPRIFNLNAWFYAGGYQMDGQGVSEFGEKGGVRGYIMNDLAIDVGVRDDDLFGTTTVFQIVWTPGRVTATPSSWSHTIDDRMREQVWRNSYVAVTRTTVNGSEELTDVNGNPFDIVHVDSTAAAGGDGTFEHPLNNLNDIQGNSTTGSIVFAHATSTFTGQSATLQDAQRFLGEGGGNTHLVTTSQLGQISLPESFAGATNAARPIIQNSAGSAAVVLAGGNDSVESLAEIEVSNFDITGGARGIFSPTGVGDVNINRLAISNTTGNGIELTPLTETLVNNTTRSRFTPTIDDVTFANVGGDDVNINGATTQTTITETIAISNVESDNGNGVGIRLTETQRAATITNFDWNGGATGDGALLIDNTVTQGTVTMNGTNTITGGTVGSAFAISLEGGAATHTVTGTTILNTGGASIVANGGTAGLNFTGRIDQANDASVLAVSGGHDGNMTFTELTANAGVIGATAGNGLQFDNADGVYTFNDKVKIEGAAGSGATSAVNVLNDSSGVLTFTDAEFTNINGDAITFNGGTANMTLTGRIRQEANAQAVLTVIGGHDGTLAFTEITPNVGVINATTGDGLQFNNADGAYTFNDRVLLTGTTEGIVVENTSSGTFAFTDANNAITNPTAGGDAIVIQASDSIFTYNGAITANAGSGRAVTIGGPLVANGNTGGTVTIGAAITSTGEGILIQNNSGGTNAFTGAVSLATGAQDAVVINDNTGGTTSFNNIDITTTAGDAFTVANNAPHAVTVTGTDNTITTTTGVGINMNNATVGGSGINFRSVNVDGAVNGIILNNVTGGSVNVGGGTVSNGQGGTIQNTTGNAIQLSNVASFSMNHMVVTGTAAAFDGIEVNHTNASVSSVAISNSQIDDGDSGIDYNRTTASATSRLTVSGVTIANTAAAGIAIDVSGTADANVTINNNTSVTNTNNVQALAFNTTGGANKTVRVLVDGSSFNNGSNLVAAADFQFAGTGTMNANITNNTFNNSGTEVAFEMASNSAATNVRLNLDSNIATSSGANDYLLDENAGDFDVVDLAAVAAGTSNTGTVQFEPNQAAFGDIPGPVPPPQ